MKDSLHPSAKSCPDDGALVFEHDNQIIECPECHTQWKAGAAGRYYRIETHAEVVA